MRRLSPCVAIVIVASGLVGCTGVQSALSPHGPVSARISVLAWVLFAVATLIFGIVLAATWISIFGSPALRSRIADVSMVVIGGIIFPTAVLTLLLGYGIWLTQLSVPAGDGKEPLRIDVVGEQWWWRIAYTVGNEKVAAANEIRIPTGRTIDFYLRSADVIHSFWVPGLGGKVDMIPGRTTRLRVAASRAGVFRGQCAEYCGGPHALMAFEVVALAPSEFDKWLTSQAAPAREPTSEQAELGRNLFNSAGCGGCHTVRGTKARGAIGPDLSHVGSRRLIAAGLLPVSRTSFARFISDNQHIKPGNRMPPYKIFQPSERQAIAAYLTDLR